MKTLMVHHNADTNVDRTGMDVYVTLYSLKIAQCYREFFIFLAMQI